MTDIPEPHTLDSADICRDGGTYLVLYLDRHGHVHEIELPVIINGGFARVGYMPPVLRSYDPTARGSILASRQLSWDEGIELRSKLVRLLNHEIGMGGRTRAEEMFDLLLLRGALPE